MGEEVSLSNPLCGSQQCPKVSNIPAETHGRSQGTGEQNSPKEGVGGKNPAWSSKQKMPGQGWSVQPTAVNLKV